MPHRIVLVVLLGVLAGCQTTSRPPIVIAHRGGAMEVPENTLAACRFAIERGFECVEIDVRLSGDARAVVIHDSTVDRTADKAAMGLVRYLDLSTLKTFDVGAVFGERFRGERIPTLEEILLLPWSTSTRLMIEVKRETDPDLPGVLPDDHSLAEAVARAVRTVPEREGLMLASFSPILLQELHRRLPEIPLIGIASTLEDLEPHFALPLTAVALNRKHVTRAFIDRMRRRRIDVWCWTVRKEPEIGPLLDAGVDGIITDIPTAVRTKINGN